MRVVREYVDSVFSVYSVHCYDCALVVDLHVCACLHGYYVLVAQCWTPELVKSDVDFGVSLAEEQHQRV